ncbi:hypothetical protein Tco_1312671 [Tanacetum coccineum]
MLIKSIIVSFYHHKPKVEDTNVMQTGISSDETSCLGPNAVKQKLALAYPSYLAENLKAEVLEVDDHVNAVLESNQPERWTTTWWQQVTVFLRRENRRTNLLATIVGRNTVFLNCEISRSGFKTPERELVERELGIDFSYQEQCFKPIFESETSWRDTGGEVHKEEKIVNDFEHKFIQWLRNDRGEFLCQEDHNPAANPSGENGKA